MAGKYSSITQCTVHIFFLSRSMLIREARGIMSDLAAKRYYDRSLAAVCLKHDFTEICPVLGQQETFFFKHNGRSSAFQLRRNRIDPVY